MDSIKKLEEKWMMNQRISNNGKSGAENDEHCTEKSCNREVHTMLCNYFVMHYTEFLTYNNQSYHDLFDLIVLKIVMGNAVLGA